MCANNKRYSFFFALCVHQAHYILDGAKIIRASRSAYTLSVCVYFKACIIIVTYFVAFFCAVVVFFYSCSFQLCPAHICFSVAMKSNESHQTTETFTFCGIFHFFFSRPLSVSLSFSLNSAIFICSIFITVLMSLEIVFIKLSIEHGTNEHEYR